MQFFYNFFTSHLLLHNLQEKGFRATGTIRDNRIEICNMKSSKQLDKMQRGTYDIRFDEKNETTIVRWKDNKSLAVATNFDSIECTSKLQRWSLEKRERVTILQPNLINTYNKHMEGVGHHDWLLQKHTIAIRSKNWYWCLYTRIIDMELVNASILYRNIHGCNSMTIKDFRRAVFVKYLKLRIGRKVLNGSLSSSLQPKNSMVVIMLVMTD